jgi:hypothetical protein
MNELYFAADGLLDAVSKYVFKLKKGEASTLNEWEDVQDAFDRCERVISHRRIVL